MAIKLGSSDIAAAYLGSTSVSAIYLGTSQVWSSSPIVRVFVFAGQSNMDGRDANLPAHLSAVDSGIKIWNGSAFVNLQNNVNNDVLDDSAGNWSAEAQFTYLYRQAHPSETIYIVKKAIGGTKLAADAGTDWNPASVGEFWDVLVTEANEAKAALQAANPGATVVVTGFWMQGETDATNQTYADAYAANMAALTAAFRSEIGDGTSRFVIGRIADYSGTGSFRATVRAAQKAVADAEALTFIVNTDTYPTADNLHYTAAGLQSLGADMYAAYATGGDVGFIADTTAPVLSSVTTGTPSTTSTTVGVTTDEGNGTVYVVVTTSATPPSAAQIKAGQNAGGTAAAYSSSQAISSTGAKTFTVSGLTASTAYYVYFMHEDAATNRSAVASGSFTTAATASFNAPTFYLANGAGSGLTTASDPGVLSPSGTAALKGTESTAAELHQLVQSGTANNSYTAGVAKTQYAHVKPGTCDRVQWFFGSGVVAYANFELSGAGSISSQNNTGGMTFSITALPNGWYELSSTYTHGSTSSFAFGLATLITGSETRAPSVSGTGRTYWVGQP